MKKKGLVAFLVSMLLVLPLVMACPRPVDPEVLPPIRVGVGGPFTGINAKYGELMIRGAELMAEEVNAAGGIEGRMIELVKFDSVGDPKEGVAAAHLAAGDPTIPVLVGFVFSGVTFSAQPVLRDAGLVNISPTNTHVDIGRMSEYTFRVVFTDLFQAEFLARYVHEVLGLKRVAVMHELADYHIGLRDAFVPAAKARGVEVVAIEAYATGAIDFLPSLTKIKGLAPEAIFLASYFSEAGMIVKQAREVLGMDVLFFSADGVMMPAFVDIAGIENAEGVIGSLPFIADKALAGPVTLEFLLAFEERFGLEADWVAAKTYDALGVVIRALRAVGPDVDFDAMAMRPLIREYFAAMTSPEVGYEGVTGLLFFDEVGDSVGPAFMGIFEDGMIRMHPRQLLD